jgi:hypothetical protein
VINHVPPIMLGGGKLAGQHPVRVKLDVSDERRFADKRASLGSERVWLGVRDGIRNWLLTAA